MHQLGGLEVGRVWQGSRDSNPEPTDLESVALTDWSYCPSCANAERTRRRGAAARCRFWRRCVPRGREVQSRSGVMTPEDSSPEPDGAAAPPAGEPPSPRTIAAESIPPSRLDQDALRVIS